jgi:hypothetical protein
MATEVERMIQTYERLGWCPVKWAHHPKPIKDALRAVGIRPAMKQCFANCQRLMISRHPIVEALEYREGYVVSLIPMIHAWLIFEGERVDLTLQPDRDDVEYLDSVAYDAEGVVRGILRNKCFGPLDERRLAELDPLRPQWAKLRKLQEANDGT